MKLQYYETFVNAYNEYNYEKKNEYIICTSEKNNILCKKLDDYLKIIHVMAALR